MRARWNKTLALSLGLPQFGEAEIIKKKRIVRENAKFAPVPKKLWFKVLSTSRHHLE